MPWCGFNQQMLEGMKNFHEGLIENLLNEMMSEDKEKVPSGGKDAPLRI